MNWQVPDDLWKGQTVAIMASGPSMSAAIAGRIKERGVIAIVINTTWQLAPWAHMLYAADAQWWNEYWHRVKDFVGLKVTCLPEAKPELLSLRVSGYDGFDEDGRFLRTGRNSGYQALHIAMKAGASRVELHGYDMRGGHWHGNHPPTLRNHGEDIFKRYIPAFESLVPIAKKKGVEIVNCTPNSALTYFPCEAAP